MNADGSSVICLANVIDAIIPVPNPLNKYEGMSILKVDAKQPDCA
jgi:hypothetical protein